MTIDHQRVESAYGRARDALLAERQAGGYWLGELSSSALATATAVTALAVVQRTEPPHSERARLIGAGLNWLIDNQNADGGWGDTVKSLSNISTTMLCRAAFHATGKATENSAALSRCEHWLSSFGKTPAELAEAVRQRYGKDRTFSVPILLMCALAGLVPWREVPRLPFEMACLPQAWYRLARLPVVSYALPALIAIGQAVHHHRGTWNPLTGPLRWLSKRRSLKVLERIQPENGGFLEATPLTSFVVMSLASLARSVTGAAERVIDRGVDFIVKSARPDGSWPIDSNLSVWVTTLSINALAVADDLAALDGRKELLAWLLQQQTKEVHPYTGAAAGAWGWSHLPGSVPDCDDTPGALLALRVLAESDDLAVVDQLVRSTVGHVPVDDEFEEVMSRVCDSNEADSIAVRAHWGLGWVRDLQNADAGFPTFCRGWGKLPFDRSGSDLTAHALRACGAWRVPQTAPSVAAIVLDCVGVSLRMGSQAIRLISRSQLADAIGSGFGYLAAQQRPDGSWLPLWFGNQHAPDESNPVYGTCKVLAAYRDLERAEVAEAQRGIAFLLDVQNPDGGWGGTKGTPSSVEETALAVEILADLSPRAACQQLERGIQYLVDRVEAGTFTEPTPIGFYFAKLWYFEKLYPIVFTVAALGRARRLVNQESPT